MATRGSLSKKWDSEEEANERPQYVKTVKPQNKKSLFFAVVMAIIVIVVLYLLIKIM